MTLGSKWGAFLQKIGGKKWLVWVGLAGVLLLGLSEWLPSGGGKAQAAQEAVTLTAQQVEDALEKRITTLLEQVEGVGACRVMVTLDNTSKTLYAADSTLSSSTGTDGAVSQTTAESPLFVQTEKGPVGLPLTEIQPAVRGVAVVCAGGGNPTVCEQVTELVATAFHISSRRVCVVKQK